MVEVENQVRQLVSELAETAARHDDALRRKDDDILDLKRKLHDAEQENKLLRNFRENKSDIGMEDGLKKEQEQFLSVINNLKAECEEKIEILQRSHAETILKLEDYQFLEFDSEESMHEFDRLYSIYGEYVGSGPEKLLEFWFLIGGSQGWHKTLRISQIRLLFSRDKNTTQLRYRVNNENIPVHGGTLIPENEVNSFFSVIIPRLPYLEYFALYECNATPFNWDLIGNVRLHYQPFPSIKGLDLRFTRGLDTDIVQFVASAPSLQPYSGVYRLCEEEDTYFYDGLWIDDWCISYTALDRDTVERRCGKKLLIVC